MKAIKQASPSPIVNHQLSTKNKSKSSKKKKTSPKSSELEKGKQIVDPEIETPDMNISVAKPISSTDVQKKRRRLIIAESSQSIEHVVDQLKISNEEQTKKVDSNPEVYINKPHIRSSNKMRLKHKLIANPKLKDLVINVEDTHVPKEKAKKMKDKK